LEEFIVGWAREIPSDASLALVVHLDRPAGLPEEPAILRDAIREFFSERAQASRRRLRQLFKRGRTSLAIGITFLALSLMIGDVVARLFGERRVRSGARACSSADGSPCGARWRCFCVTGGRFAPTRASLTD